MRRYLLVRRQGSRPPDWLGKQARKDLNQFLVPNRLLQQGPFAVAFPHVLSAVAGCENEWHAERVELVGHGKALRAIQVHIQHCGVEDLRINQGDGEPRPRTLPAGGEYDRFGGSSEFAQPRPCLFFYRASCTLRGRVNTGQFSGILANTLPQRVSKSTLPVAVLSITSLRSASPRWPSCALSRNGSDASSAAQAAS